ncbi:MAG: Ig-like domain-containing protein, partial [Verrucomicrobiae bacterium]|nr:Ig-like domain-containing protein [Verrucomicrobiae bacterium]
MAGELPEYCACLLYVPPQDWSGIDTFTWTIGRPNGAYATTNVVLYVTNSPPAHRVGRLDIYWGTNRLINGKSTLFFQTALGNPPTTATLTLTNPIGESWVQLGEWAFENLAGVAGTFDTSPGESAWHSIFLQHDPASSGPSTNLNIIFTPTNVGSMRAALRINYGTQLLVDSFLIFFDVTVTPLEGACPQSQLPSVRLMAPSSNSVFAAYQNVLFEAELTNYAGKPPVTNVVFVYATASNPQESYLLGQDAFPPYSVTGALPPGSYNIKAYALNANGCSAVSEPVPITVRAPSQIETNAPPVAVDDERFYPMLTNGTAAYCIPVLQNDYDPNGDPLTITDFTQPTSGTITLNGNELCYQPEPYRYGKVVFYYLISDGKGGQAYAKVTINLMYDPPPVVEIVSPPDGFYLPLQRNAPTNITLRVNASDGVTNVTYFAHRRIIGESTNPPTFGVIWANPPAGTHFLRALALATNGTKTYSDWVTVTVTPPLGNSLPVAAISNFAPTLPAGLTNLPVLPIIRESVTNLVGTIGDPDREDSVWLQVLLYDGQGNFVAELTDGFISLTGKPKGVTNSVLAALNFDPFENGTYEIELNVTDGYAMTSDRRQFILDKQLKLGQFTFSVQDVVVPVNGIPLTISRTYDSRNTSTNTDFGPCWSLVLLDMNAELNEWREDVLDDEGEQFSLRIGGSYDVTLTLPDGRRATFAFYLEGPCLCTQGSDYRGCYKPKWRPPPGVQATLECLDQPELIALGGMAFWSSAGLNTS